MRTFVEPLVSIGMPAYNGELFIRKALDSLLKQDYRNIELIISNNASTDSTLQICEEYVSKDKRVKVITQKYNMGAFLNFQFVLEMATGKYFMWAAVDDYWSPTFVTEMVMELEKHLQAGVAMCAVDRIYPNGESLDTISFTNKDNPNNRTYYQMLQSLTSGKKYNLFIYGLFRTELLKRAAVVFPNVTGSDRLFIFQLALATRFRFINKVLHIRTSHIIPSRIRMPDETFNRMENNKWVNVLVLSALARMIIKSKVIPWYRKFYLPIGVWGYARLLYLPKIKFKLVKLFPRTWNFVKKARNFY